MTRRVALILVLALFLAACGSSGEPSSLDEQPVPVGDELGAALGVDGDDELPVVERNFLEGCILTDSPRIDGTNDQVASCQCTFNALKAFYVDAAQNEGSTDVAARAYDLFKKLDKDLQAEGSLVPANVQSIIGDCTQ